MTLQIFSGQGALPDGFAALCDAAGKDSFFQRPDWFSLLGRTALSDGETVLYPGLEEDGKPAVLLPLRRAGGESLIRRLASHSNFYSMNFAPVIAPGLDATDTLAKFFAALREDCPGWDAIRLGPLDAADGTLHMVTDALRAAGLTTRPFFEFGNWYEPVADGGFDDFVAARPSQLRNTWKRRTRKLERETTFDMAIATEGAALEAALDAYQQIYAESWKEPELFPEFIPALVREFGPKDLLRLGTLTVDGKPAAAQIWLRDGDRAIIYKLAYDDAMRGYSAGTILTMHMAKHAIEVDRVTEIDYGSGDDPYKRDWMSKRRERWGVIAYNPSSLRGIAGGIRERVAALLRRRPAPATERDS